MFFIDFLRYWLLWSEGRLTINNHVTMPNLSFYGEKKRLSHKITLLAFNSLENLCKIWKPWYLQASTRQVAPGKKQREEIKFKLGGNYEMRKLIKVLLCSFVRSLVGSLVRVPRNNNKIIKNTHFSWTWKPCFPGANPMISIWMNTASVHDGWEKVISKWVCVEIELKRDKWKILILVAIWDLKDYLSHTSKHFIRKAQYGNSFCWLFIVTISSTT